MKTLHSLNRVSSFQLKEFPWLFYSPSENATFCLSCVLFGFKFPPKASWIKNLYSQLFRHWPAAVSTFKIHVSSKKKEKSNKPVQSLHSQAWPILEAVLCNMKGLVEEIDLMIVKNCKKEVKENRKRLVPKLLNWSSVS